MKLLTLLPLRANLLYILHYETPCNLPENGLSGSLTIMSSDCCCTIKISPFLVWSVGLWWFEEVVKVILDKILSLTSNFLPSWPLPSDSLSEVFTVMFWPLTRCCDKLLQYEVICLFIRSSVSAYEICLIATNITPGIKKTYLITSVPKKSIPSTVVTHYCAWYTFFRNRRYQILCKL